MACSDNVVRAGLTGKYRDKDTLCQMLTYNMDTPTANKFSSKPHLLASCIRVYDPPTPEFSVNRICLQQELELPAVRGAYVCLCVFSASVIY